MIHQKYWFDMILRVLYNLQAFSLMVIAISGFIVKPESKSPIPCSNRPQILTLGSDQV